VCPTGWHVPTEAEWNILIKYLGSLMVAGGKMKALTYWDSPNTGATNTSLFTGLPGGYRARSFGFLSSGKRGCWWSSTIPDWPANNVYYYELINNRADVSSGTTPRQELGLSVRCIKD
jgi:uncharacterized protein (TIGR02145 family)